MFDATFSAMRTSPPRKMNVRSPLLRDGHLVRSQGADVGETVKRLPGALQHHGSPWRPVAGEHDLPARSERVEGVEELLLRGLLGQELDVVDEERSTFRIFLNSASWR
jgi:hypothetical protein